MIPHGVPPAPSSPFEVRVAAALARLEQDMVDMKRDLVLNRPRPAPPPPPPRPAPPRPRTVRRARPKPDLGPSPLTLPMRVVMKAQAHGLTQTAMARCLGITAAAVSYRLSRARARCEERLAQAMNP